jgi:hypothetical protein
MNVRKKENGQQPNLFHTEGMIIDLTPTFWNDKFFANLE